MEEICSVCNNQKSNHSDNLKKELTSRINRISGQLSGIIRMINDNVYCDDVLNQLSSASSALNGAKKILLEAHIKSCVLDKIKNGDYDVLDELMITIGKMIK